ncbi:ATP synthase F0 subunit 8 (mitochondrion) [Rhodnius prolixus]|uniref:ATP synthase complex subunit 8 n=1 Tax=Rhodnius prolixus TaxID=13249 RepID=A0A7D7JRW1_RHOPR|nr:ATP synthase F0 subunit 8 [Rhodnius prolixus]QMP96823.1 ATP synthase F0 subunit 8 [Rhodnius prolixus]
MPQMAPLWWTTMFFTFTLSFIIIFMILHFQNYYSPTSTKTNIKSTMPEVNWKW